MKGLIAEKIEYFTFDEKKFLKEIRNFSFGKGFVLKIRLSNLPQTIGKTTILKIGGMELSFVNRNAKDREAFPEKADRNWIHADEDGYVASLEMKADFLSPYREEPREMICSLLLGLFDTVKKGAYFVYDGVRFLWVYDGEIANINYPFGSPVITAEEIVVGEFVADWGIADISAFQEEEREDLVEKNMAFYSPRGYNAYVGDIANFYKDGVYHMLYLCDRHHHGSRWGGGAHYVCQITTTDFIHWQDNGPIVRIDEQWKSIGTGTMFFHNGKYYYSHGWHTSRMVPVEKTGSILVNERSSENEVYGVTYGELKEKGLIPAGAGFVVSNDGIHFESGEYQFHTVENPSIYAEKDGSLTMYGGYGGAGVWKANCVEGPWQREDGFEMNASPLKPSTECPCKFELNGYKYLLVGGTGYWKTEKDEKVFKDEAKEGYDVYDGLFVPMVTKTENERLIYSGWIRGYGWGSVAIHRELFQGEKGRLYMRWLPELAPQAEELEKTDGCILKERESYYLEADILPSKDGKVGLRFIGESDCILLLDSERESIQISRVEKSEAYPREILPLYLRAREEEIPHCSDIWGDFSIGRAEHLKENYKLRVIVYYEKKFDSVILDAEIGGKRTIVSNRIEQRFKSFSWITQNAMVRNVKLYRINSAVGGF